MRIKPNIIENENRITLNYTILFYSHFHPKGGKIKKDMWANIKIFRCENDA